MPIQWRSSGLTTTRPVALIDTGGNTNVGNWLAERLPDQWIYHFVVLQRRQHQRRQQPGAAEVYQSYAYTGCTVGNELAYQLPVPDGTYTIRLHFTEPSYNAGQRQVRHPLAGEHRAIQLRHRRRGRRELTKPRPCPSR